MTKRLMISICCLFLMVTTALADELSSYRADITATRYGAIDIRADGSTSFSINGDKWQIETKVRGGGLKSEESSKGFVENGIFKPESYHKLTKFLFIKENVDWDFDWNAKKVKGKVKKDKYEYSLGDSLHDPISFQPAIRLAVANGETSLNYEYLRYNRPQELSFEVIGEELLSLEKGRVHTLILRQIKPLSSSKKNLIWVARDFDFIPVRFASYKDNKMKDDIIVNRLWIADQEVNFDNP
jgi:hypothetical protein